MNKASWKDFVIELYKNDQFLRALKVQAKDRHHAEERARHEIRTTDAESMGTVDEILK